MAIEIVDFPIKNGGSFHSYVKLPEGNLKSPKKEMIESGQLIQFPWTGTSDPSVKQGILNRLVNGKTPRIE